MRYPSNAQRFAHVSVEIQKDAVRTAVLRLVRASDQTFLDVISKLSARNIDEATIKAELFRLSSEGQIEITPDWVIRFAVCGR